MSNVIKLPRNNIRLYTKTASQALVMTKEEFRAGRIKLKLTQYALARLFGVSDQTIARWESGKSGLDGSAKILMLLMLQEQDNKNGS